MDYARVLKWLMIGTVLPLVIAVPLFFVGVYLSEGVLGAVSVLYVVGRYFFLAWFVALAVAVISYYRVKRKRKEKG